MTGAAISAATWALRVVLAASVVGVAALTLLGAL